MGPISESISLFSGILTSTSNEEWDEVRKFTLKELGETGFRERATEDKILLSLKYLVEYLGDGHSSICLHDALYAPTTQYVWHMLTGHELSLQNMLKLRDALLEFKN